VAYNKALPSLKEVFKIGLTFILAVFAWIFFRAENLAHAFSYIRGIFQKNLFQKPPILPECGYVVCLVLFFMFIEWLGRKEQFAIERLGFELWRPLRWFFYSFVIFLIFMFMQTEETPFIYFQF